MAVLDGEARVLLTAQQIVKALGTTDAMTDDMIQVLSKFDHRFSGMTEKKKILMDDKKSTEPSTSQKVEDSVPPHQQQQTAPRGARGGRHAKANDFALDAAESVIEQWGMSGDEESRWIFDGPQEESSSCMEAVDEVLKQLESMKIHNRDPETLERAQNLLQLAMEKLVEEFRHLLESCSGSVDPDLLLDSFSAGSFNQALNEIGNLEGSSSNPDAETTSGDDDAENDEDDDDDVSKSRPLGEPQLTVALVPAEVAQGLSDIATRLIAGGYKRECVQVYVSSRKGVLEESLSSLGAERLSIDEVQKMGWPLQEEKITKWNQAIKVGVRVLFASEKQLCDQVHYSLFPVGNKKHKSCFFLSSNCTIGM
jgi:exocyst complex protein 7